jgi:hypothetical protein
MAIIIEERQGLKPTDPAQALRRGELLELKAATIARNMATRVQGANPAFRAVGGSEHTEKVQRFFRAMGLGVTVDGKLGPITVGLTRTVQDACILGTYRTNPLTVDGKPGPQTSAAIDYMTANGYRVAENFAWWEWFTKNPDKRVTTRNRGVLLTRATITLAQNIRDEVGPFSPVSAYRDPDWNAHIGGATNSMHMYGKAFDVDSNTLKLSEEQVRRLGARGVGIVRATGFVAHVDTRDYPALWWY